MSKIVDRLLRPLNRSDGRDVKELGPRMCDEGNDKLCYKNDGNEMNDKIYFKKIC